VQILADVVVVVDDEDTELRHGLQSP